MNGIGPHADLRTAWKGLVTGCPAMRAGNWSVVGLVFAHHYLHGGHPGNVLRADLRTELWKGPVTGCSAMGTLSLSVVELVIAQTATRLPAVVLVVSLKKPPEVAASVAEQAQQVPASGCRFPWACSIVARAPLKAALKVEAMGDPTHTHVSPAKGVTAESAALTVYAAMSDYPVEAPRKRQFAWNQQLPWVQHLSLHLLGDRTSQ